MDKQNVPFETDLCEIFYRHKVDKCPQLLHSYSPEYFRLLNDFRKSFKKVLEIGIGTYEMMSPLVGLDYKPGASLRAWREFFPNATINGADINETVIFKDERINCFQVDQSNTEQLDKLAKSLTKDGKKLDLIIDDGSHQMDHMINTFNALWPYLEEGGVYIIEDIQAKDVNEFLEVSNIKQATQKLVHRGKYYWDAFIAITKKTSLGITIFDNRNEMIKQLLAPNSVIAEIGVFDGGFSQCILNINNPKELVLIDYWGDGIVVSGDVDGNNIRHMQGLELYNIVKEKFAANSNVKVIRDWSSCITKFPDNYFDAIYIDADHEYPAVLNDIQAAFAKVKPGGWIFGHDFEMNNAKTAACYTFGVKRSAEEFCEKYNQHIAVKAMDGCVSFGIKVEK
jgi:23S rRNA U2552 (ribose-2'-O)-methylase RlmE/FtsJ